MCLVDNAAVVLPGAVDVASPRIDKLTEDLATTKADVLSLKSNLYNL